MDKPLIALVGEKIAITASSVNGRPCLARAVSERKPTAVRPVLFDSESASA
jgi:hypothetical protein